MKANHPARAFTGKQLEAGRTLSYVNEMQTSVKIVAVKTITHFVGASANIDNMKATRPPGGGGAFTEKRLEAGRTFSDFNAISM
eukprot:4733560-Karenia_brevis.AAC.1